MTKPDYSAEHQARIDAAQRLTHYTVFRARFPRIAYGDDYPTWPKYCRDCAVKQGQYHVLGCCIERCPACLGQEIACGCRDDLPGEVIPK